MMDRGFELMIPKSKEEDKNKDTFNYGLKFTLFGSEYSLQFKVNRKE